MYTFIICNFSLQFGFQIVVSVATILKPTQHCQIWFFTVKSAIIDRCILFFCLRNFSVLVAIKEIKKKRLTSLSK